MNFPNRVHIYVTIFILMCSIGYIFGNYLLAKTISGSSVVLLLFFRPLDIHVIIHNKLYSNDPIERLTGYCALLEFRLVDHAFLYERYKQEDNIASKRVILKILSLHPTDELYNFLDSMYELSDVLLQKQIVSIIKLHFPENLAQFAQKHKIDAQWLHE